MNTVAIDELGPALGLGPHEHIAVVGAGGKTTLVNHLSRHLEGRRILTTTTKMGHDQAADLPVLVSPSVSEIEAIEGLVVVWRVIDEPVALGVAPVSCDRWFPLVDHVIVEADGARRRPFKAPAGHEPVVPATATLVISVIGADALGYAIEDRCHRPELVAQLAGCRSDVLLTPEAAARVLLHPRGNRASVPPGARLVFVVTKVNRQREALVSRLAAALRAQSPHHGGEGPPSTDPVPLFAIAHG